MLFATNVSWVYEWQVIPGSMMMYVPAFTLTPRLVLSLRHLYARDLRSRHGSDIDTAFGLTSSGHAAVVSEIVFADGGQNLGKEQGREEVGEQDGEIQTEDRATPTSASV